MGKYIMLTKDLINELAALGTDLNAKISFENYLLKSGYTPLSERLFMKENPLELIRLSKENGEKVYQNFENKEDKGTLMDFIRNRSLDEGKVHPNQKVTTFIAAVDTAKAFHQKYPGQRPKPRELRALALKARTPKI